MSRNSSKKLIVIAGATAVGKTALTIRLAEYLNCAILSADSRQCYRELGVAVAKPTAAELAAVPHYFINSHSIHEEVNAATFESYGLKVLQDEFAQRDYCVMTGGSGLYIQAVCQGLDELPPIDPKIRAHLHQEWEQKGTAWLAQELQQVDPTYYELADLNNHRRLLRALEVFHSTNTPYSQFRQNKPKPRPFEIIQVVLDRPRRELYQRIDHRMDLMIQEGLFEEAEALFEFRHLKPLQTVGYQEIFDYLEGKYSKSEAVRLLKRNSRRYAKRQLTWWRKDERNQWLNANDWDQLLALISRY